MREAYEYFAHDADVGIVGRGATLEEAFESAAAATFAIVADPALVREALEADVSFSEGDVELALVRWLNALLASAREQRAVYRRFALTRRQDRWQGRAWGEAWRDDLARGVEVKGATLTMLRVEQTAAGWEAACVVDV